MKSKTIFRIKFYYTLLNTKITLFILLLKNLFNKKSRLKIKNFQSMLDEPKRFV